MFSAPDQNEKFTIPVLKPEPQHGRVVQLVSQFLTKNHYKDMSLDDSLSSQLLNNYLELLDYNKMYFLKTDVDNFEQERYKFDEYLLTGRLNHVYDIFNLYQKRLEERLNFVFEQLDKPFDFTKIEYFYPNRDSIGWAESQEELDNYWRKRIKNEYLNLKLAEKEESDIKEILTKRYTNIYRRLSQNQSEDVIDVYLNSLSRIFDPHTNYFSPKDKDDFKIRMSLSLEGIGARLTTENDYTKVVEIVPGGPADKDGRIKPNDFIIGVQQQGEEMVDVIGWRIDDVVQLIRGPKGSQVTLQVLHDENIPISEAEFIDLTRDKIKLEDSAAKADTIQINDDKRFTLGVITIPNFYFDFESMRAGDPNYKSTTRDVEKILDDLQEQKVDGIIIDLRGNGGGFLSEAIELTGLFIEDGPVVQVKDLFGNIKVERDNDDRVLYIGPLAVLVDQFSASASEIFAAAIQDYNRGLVIGNQTYGKGTVQNVKDLNKYFPNSNTNYGQIKFTIAKFYRVNGGSTQHVGVIPDIELPSRFEHDDIGESSQKNALLWDQINSTKYNAYKDRMNSIIESLKLNHESRMTNNIAFNDYLKTIEEFKELTNTKKISLNEEVRKKEKEENKDKKKKLDREQENKLILKESARILTDYIKITNK